MLQLKITQFESSILWFYVKWKVYCLFDRIKTLVMFDEENKTKTYKKVKSHKKVILDILWRKKEKI